MPDQLQLQRVQKLLEAQGMNLRDVERLARQTTWYRPDGRSMRLPTALYDSERYLARGYLLRKLIPPPPKEHQLPLVRAVMAFARDKEAWEGSPTTLLAELEQIALDASRTRDLPRWWPKDTARMVKELLRLAPALED